MNSKVLIENRNRLEVTNKRRVILLESSKRLIKRDDDDDDDDDDVRRDAICSCRLLEVMMRLGRDVFPD